MHVYFTLSIAITFFIFSGLFSFLRIESWFEMSWDFIVGVLILSFLPEFRRALFSFPSAKILTFTASVSSLLFLLSSIFFAYAVLWDLSNQWWILVLCIIFLIIWMATTETIENTVNLARSFYQDNIQGRKNKEVLSDADETQRHVRQDNHVARLMRKTRVQSQEVSQGKSLIAQIIFLSEILLYVLVYILILLRVFFHSQPLSIWVVILVLFWMNIAHEYYARYSSTKQKRVRIDFSTINLLIISTLSLLLMSPFLIHSVRILWWWTGGISIWLSTLFIVIITVFSLYFRRGNQSII